MYNSSIKPENRVRELRLESGMKTETLAKQLNMSTSMLQQIETRKRTISPSTLIKLSKIFNVSTDYILCLTTKREQNK